MPEYSEWALLAVLRESGADLEAHPPMFDVTASGVWLRRLAQARGLLMPGGVQNHDLANTGAELEVVAPPFSVDAGAARLSEAAHARGLIGGNQPAKDRNSTLSLAGRTTSIDYSAAISGIPRISRSLVDSLFNLNQGRRVDRYCPSCGDMTAQVTLSYSQLPPLSQHELAKVAGRLLDVIPGVSFLTGRPTLCHCGTLNR